MEWPRKVNIMYETKFTPNEFPVILYIGGTLISEQLDISTVDF